MMAYLRKEALPPATPIVVDGSGTAVQEKIHPESKMPKPITVVQGEQTSPVDSPLLYENKVLSFEAPPPCPVTPPSLSSLPKQENILIKSQIEKIEEKIEEKEKKKEKKKEKTKKGEKSKKAKKGKKGKEDKEEKEEKEDKKEEKKEEKSKKAKKGKKGK